MSEWTSLLRDAALHGSAIRAADTVELTNVEHSVQGALLMRTPLESSSAGAASFAITFELLAGGGTGGEGLGVSFAPVSSVQHADETGVSAGLVVAFETAAERVRVLMRGEMLQERRLDGSDPIRCDELNCANCARGSTNVATTLRAPRMPARW